MIRAKNFKECSRPLARYKFLTNNRYFYPVLLVIVTFVVFFQVIGHEFINYDDDLLVFKNPYMQSFTIENIAHFWGNPDYGNLYIPMTQTIWAIEAVFAKTTPSDSNKIIFDPSVFHSANLIFHIFNALLVFLILRILIKDELACFLGALLFALHPVQVEPVAWVTGLKDVLCGFFSFIAIWQYLLYTKLSMNSPEGNEADQDYKKRKNLHYLISIFSFLLAILSKPTGVSVLIVIFALDYFILKRPFRQIAVSLIGWIATALPIIIVTILLKHSKFGTMFSLSFLDRFLISTDSLAFYLYKILLPASLGPDYGRTPKLVLSQNVIYVAWIIPVVFVILVYIFKKQRSWLLASAGIFIAGIAPVLGYIQFEFQQISTVADRYLYLSMLGPGMVLAFFISQDMLSLNRKRLIIGICSVILGSLGIFSMLQTQYWKDSATLFQHGIKVNPDSEVSHNNLGIALMQQGKIDEAVFHYYQAFKNSPNPMRVHNNLAVALEKQGKYDEAISHFSEALKNHPNKAGVYTRIGRILAQQGKFKEAILNFHEALRLNSDNVQAHIALGAVLVLQGKIDEAISHFSEALKINPNNAEAHLELGYILIRQGKIDEAVFHFSEAVRLSPDDVEAHNNLGVALAQQGKYNEAIYQFTEALKIDPGNQEAYNNLTRAKSLKNKF